VGQSSFFTRFSARIATSTGHPFTFMLALITIVVWAVLGPVFAFHNTWQLVINTATSLVTFLMVFLIQNTQNRDGVAIQIKLDELIRATERAHNALLDLEELDEAQLRRLRDRYEELARLARADLTDMLDHGVDKDAP